ncbi:MAG: secondary thiamine-phosphate synthase enzyme YjbQ [Thermoplasmata archaeon]|nr:secondary thiamine-phosphate synthase enzyme YjbQ [Thermoplasmata archaeon]
MKTTFDVKTGSRVELVDVTNKVRKAVNKSGVKEGICHLFVPHTTAGIAINENADPSVKRDIVMEMNKMVPFEDGYQHMEGNAAAHIKSVIFGPNLSLFVEGGDIVLGTWQGVFFCEFDGPRSRKVHMKVIEG